MFNVRFAGMTKKPTEETLKTTINFVDAGENKRGLPAFVPALVIGVLLLGVFSKFAIIDRYHDLHVRQARANELKSQLVANQSTTAQSKKMEDYFYHYTWSQMDDEELNRTSRTKVAKLVKFISTQLVGVHSYSISGSQLNVDVQAASLQSINSLVLKLEKRPLVDSCTVQTAKSNSPDKGVENIVEAQLVIHLASFDKTPAEKIEEEEQ